MDLVRKKVKGPSVGTLWCFVKVLRGVRCTLPITGCTRSPAKDIGRNSKSEQLTPDCHASSSSEVRRNLKSFGWWTALGIFIPPPMLRGRTITTKVERELRKSHTGRHNSQFACQVRLMVLCFIRPSSPWRIYKLKFDNQFQPAWAS